MAMKVKQSYNEKKYLDFGIESCKIIDCDKNDQNTFEAFDLIFHQH